MENAVPLLELKSITKSFSGTRVLEDVNLKIYPGEIVGLIGENGAGKTTLMSILFGMPVIAETGGYGGEILIDGKVVNFASPFEALDAGIGMVHQEFSLIPGFTTTENIMLNREITKSNFVENIFGSRMRTLNRPAMKEKAVDAIGKLGLVIDSEMLVAEMPVGYKQFTEIAREISRKNVRLLVLDEPTAVLTETEAEILLHALRKLSQEGIAVVFISHRLQEVMDLCHRVITLRDGKTIRDVAIQETNVGELAASLVGREIAQGQTFSKRELSSEVIFEVQHLQVDMPGEAVHDMSFSVRKGEIFGIGGLAGQGKLGIPNGIMGLFSSQGTVLFKGQPLELNSPLSALNAGMAFVSEDRRGMGLLLDESLEWNMVFTAMQTKNQFLRSYLGGLVKLRDEKAMEELAQSYIEMLSIKCTGPKQRAKELSGGNQQKVCLARAFCLQPEILFVSEPTRGIDVGAKEIVLDMLRKYNSEKGTTIVMISSELEELRAICDRVGIVSNGRMAGILDAQSQQTEFALLMSGD